MQRGVGKHHARASPACGLSSQRESDFSSVAPPPSLSFTQAEASLVAVATLYHQSATNLPLPAIVLRASTRQSLQLGPTPRESHFSRRFSRLE